MLNQCALMISLKYKKKSILPSLRNNTQNDNYTNSFNAKRIFLTKYFLIMFFFSSFIKC